MRLKITALASVAALVMVTGCDVSETQVTLVGISPNGGEYDPAAGTLECEFESEPNEFPVNIILDTAASFTLTLPVVARNNLSDVVTSFEGTNIEDFENPTSNNVRPIRMDVRWECDSNGFSGNLGPLVVPAFDPVVPFCLETREDANSSFSGFDVVSVSGPQIAPLGSGIATAPVIPYQMGQAIDETFRIAALADNCCEASAATNCDGQSSDASCQALTNIFALLDPDGSDLTVAVPTGPSEDLIRFQPFAIFDGNHICGKDPTSCSQSSFSGAKYPMRMRAVMEFVRGDGSLMVSDELVHDIQLCRNCGSSGGGTTRGAAVDNHNACYFAL